MSDTTSPNCFYVGDRVEWAARRPSRDGPLTLWMPVTIVGFDERGTPVVEHEDLEGHRHPAGWGYLRRRQ